MFNMFHWQKFFHRRHLFHHYARHIHHQHYSHFPGQEKALLVIWQVKKIAQNQLLTALDIKPSSLSELLGKLEKRRLIKREKDQQDKREVIVSLTPSGAQLAAELMQYQTAFSDEFLGVLTAKEKTQLTTILEKLHRHYAPDENIHFSVRGHHWQHHHHRHPKNRDHQ